MQTGPAQTPEQRGPATPREPHLAAFARCLRRAVRDTAGLDRALSELLPLLDAPWLVLMQRQPGAAGSRCPYSLRTAGPGAGCDPQAAMCAFCILAHSCWREPLKRGRASAGPVCDRSDAEQAYLNRLGVRSLALVPLPGGGGAGSFLAACDMAAPRAWRPGDLRLLETAAELLVMAVRHKRTRAELLQAQKMGILGSLAGGIAHDFNNILASISAFIQVMRADTPAPGERAQDLKDMAHEVSRGAELARQILDFAHPEQGQTNSPTVVNPCLQRIHRLLGRTLEKAVCVRCEPGRESAAVAMPPALFQQLVLNLALNARDAMPEGGTLTIRASPWAPGAAGTPPDPEAPASGEYVCVEVGDTGSGILPEDLPKIFDPFFSTKAKEFGSGLGLSIVDRIVHAYDGQIAARSTPGKGTVIRIYLPAIETAPDPAEAAPPEKLRGGGQTILVVDDEPLVLRGHCRLLERYGYRPDGCGSGREAVERLRTKREHPDLVILNLDMPAMSGRECLAELLETEPAARVIVVSGHALPRGAWDPVAAGAKAFLSKPLDLTALLRSIQKALR
ncbi:MAG: response regulator [Kiritimatiellae bacterium]|nr:response regulator [Kiritimatiellia bacterium]